MTLSLVAIRNCLEGAVPSLIATCHPDGTPNVAYISQVHFVDRDHVALTFQFFNKTRENVLLNPWAVVKVTDPDCGAEYRLSVEYLRTEPQGALFESLKAKLAGIASHTGMSKVFRLLGADVYRVHAIEPVSAPPGHVPETSSGVLSSLRACSHMLNGATDLAGLLDGALLGLDIHCGVRHGMVLMWDGAGERLYTVASRGYATSGVGSEIAMGEGVIGVAARERTPIRITHTAAEYGYSRAVRNAFQGDGRDVETEIPFPGLAEPRSQLAVPLVNGERLLGVIYVESPHDMYFRYEHEDALAVLAAHLTARVQWLEQWPAAPADAAPAPLAAPSGKPLLLRHYRADNSVFIDGDYLIKGVAGAIFCKLIRQYLDGGRTQFSNRELRRDCSIGLPQVADNLEARLILLQRRLVERCDFLRIEKTSRGRFRLVVLRPLELTTE